MSYRRWIPFCALLLLLPLRLAAQRVVADTGDFRVGDRILLSVEGEQQFSDTFTVVPGPALQLPVIGDISLAGVRHNDLQQYLTSAIGRYVRDPTVHARALVRIGVIGQVVRPGFYAVPADGLVSDVLMAAGGPTPQAELSKAKIVRNDGDGISADSLANGLAGGLTLAQLGLRSGDEIVVPAQPDARNIVQTIGILVTIPAAIIALIRIL